MTQNMSKFLYRYENFSGRCADINIRAIFEHNKIYLNSRTEFNDPFDSHPSLIGTIGKKDIFKHLEPNIKMNRADKRSRLHKRNPDEIFEKQFEERHINKIGIKSFSTKLNSIAIWSHYASSHEGYCVKFQPLESELINALEVKYSLKRPTLQKKEFLTQEQIFTEKLAEYLLIKSTEWQYESEYRIVKHDAAKQYETFDRSEIVAVYFGIKAKKEHIELIRDTNKNKKIEFYIGIKDSLDFKINFKKI